MAHAIAHAPSPEKASPFGEIKLIELDWTSEWVHLVLPLLQHRYLLLTLPFSRTTICRRGESRFTAGTCCRRQGRDRQMLRQTLPRPFFCLAGV